MLPVKQKEVRERRDLHPEHRRLLAELDALSRNMPATRRELLNSFRDCVTHSERRHERYLPS